MPKIVFIEHNGKHHVVDADVGKSVMQAAVDNMVPGIIGDCGGACSCATCHGYIDTLWTKTLEPMGEGESLMLEGAVNAQDNSRLTCQILVKPELDGLVVHLPADPF